MAEEIRKEILQVDVHLFHAQIRGDFEGRIAIAHIQFHHTVVQLSGPQHLPHFLACLRVALQLFGRRRQQKVQQLLFGIRFGAVSDFIQSFLAHHINGGFHKVTDHGFDIPANIAHFREFTRFHLQKGRTG